MTRSRGGGLSALGLGVAGVLLAVSGCAGRTVEFDVPPVVPGAGWHLWGQRGEVLSPASDFWVVRPGLRVHVNCGVVKSRGAPDRLAVMVEFDPAGPFVVDPRGVVLVPPDGRAVPVTDWAAWRFPPGRSGNSELVPGPPYESDAWPFWMHVELPVPAQRGLSIMWVGGMTHRGQPVPPLRVRLRAPAS